MKFRLSAIFAVWPLLHACGRAPVAADESFVGARRAGGAENADEGQGRGTKPPSGALTRDGSAGAVVDGGGLPNTNGHEAGGPTGGDAQVDNPSAWQPWPDGKGPKASIRLNHLQMIGTHNSYHRAPLVAADASHKYTHKPLDEQLQGGVRTFELDLHGGNDGKIHVYHIQAIDDRTTCSTLVECLGVLKSWSDTRPTHTPIFVWFEIKNDTSITPAIDDVHEVEDAILSVIPAERLITPDFIRGSYASPRARVEAEGWPALRDVSGMFAFALIDRDDLANSYSDNQTTLDGRKIWLNADANQHTQPWALITKVGGPGDSSEIADALSHHMLVATNSCGVDKSDSECQGRFDQGLSNGVHMLKDDLPFPLSGRSYYAHLPEGSPGCNAVTSSAECDNTLFE